MKNIIGDHLQVTIFGESHGAAIGGVIDGLPAGFKIDWKQVENQMKKRQGINSISTKRFEEDKVEVLSGYFNDATCGTPLAFIIRNNDTHSRDYESTKGIMRPSHADYVAHIKYNGFEDYRGGGHFSGRLTAPIVAAGSIAMQLLDKYNIKIGTHILKCNDFIDDTFSGDEKLLAKQIDDVNEMAFAMLNKTKAQACISFIEEVATKGDSVGGILQSAIINVPCGVGEPFFHSLESRISHYLFSVPGLKSVSFGIGAKFADGYGSELNDELYYDHRVKTKSNNNGGINGGISNGMPIIIESVIKPTPSIYKQQNSINIDTQKNVKLNIKGRHDPAIFHRARVVVDSMIALAIIDAMMEFKGINSMQEEGEK